MLSDRRPRVGVVCDLREENWHSMNVVADLLLEGTQNGGRRGFETARVCPPMRRRLTRAESGRGARFNADRLLNRFLDYPLHLRRRRGDFDLFHVVDHSYAQLVHHLPPARTVVTCHDLDAFRCLLDAGAEPRPPLFRAMMRRVLAGLGKAARVACDSEETRRELLAHGLVPEARLTVIPLGLRPAFGTKPAPAADAEAARLLGPAAAGSIELLHVGSTIPRKRVEDLLEVFAGVRQSFPAARLVRVGGAFTAAQEALAGRLGLGGSVAVLPYLEPEVLAAVYRRAALVVLPSEREGFGLPVAEALACGTPVVASRLAVLREVGGREAVEYCAVGDVAEWAATITRLLSEREGAPGRWAARREAGAKRASRYTREQYVAKTLALYREVLDAS